MHTTDWLAMGEDVRRVVAVSTWHESPFFSDRERTVLALTDAVTRLGEEGVTDELWAEAQKELGDELLANVILAIATINVWNRIAVPTHKLPPPLAS
jgi:alkylhydroperoxidase family enzyme